MSIAVRNARGQITRWMPGNSQVKSNAPLDTLEQLKTINRETLKFLRGARKNPLIGIRAAAEIRQQLAFQLSFLRELYDIQQQAIFQASVLEQIGLEAPEVQKRIIDRLREWRRRKQITQG